MSDQEETKTVEGAEERNYEAEARREGWVSETEWVAKGKDPSLHKPAKEFVEVGERIVPVMRAKVTRLENKLAKLEGSIASERKATLEAMQQQNTINEAKLKDALKTAVTKGDGDRVVELQDKIQEVRDANKDIKDELKAKPKNEPAPEFVAFLEENKWYSTDSDLSAEADAIGASLYKRNPNMPLDELYAEVTKKVKKLNPEKFGRKPASPDSPSSKGGENGSKPKGVPKEVSAQFDRMADMVPQAERKAFKERAIASYLANQE